MTTITKPMTTTKMTAIALITLTVSAGTQTAQAHYSNSFFIQDKNGQIKERVVQSDNSSLRNGQLNQLVNKATTTAIILPAENFPKLSLIRAEGITNLTRIVIEYRSDREIAVYARGTKIDEEDGGIVFRAGMTIVMQDQNYYGPVRRIRIDPANAKDMAKPEAKYFQPPPRIRAFQDDWGTPVTEIRWNEGILQISPDNEQWTDVPIVDYRRVIRWPQFVANHEKQFFRIKPEEEEETEEDNQ